MTKTSRRHAARKKQELRQITRISNSLVRSYAAVERNKKLPTQTTGISGPSFTQPMTTTSEPSATAPNSGSSQQRVASEKAFLGSIMIADPYPPERTEHDVTKNQWLAALCPSPLPKGMTLTEALLDLATREAALDPLPPDYDTDAEWGSYDDVCHDGSHLVNEEPDWDWFRSIGVLPPPKI